MRISVGTRLAISAAVFAAVLWFVDVRRLWTLLANAHPGWLLLALVANLAGIFLVSSVLSVLCGGTPNGLRVFRVNLISVYFSTFLPGEVAAGLVSRIRYLGLASWQEVLNRTVVERMVSLATYSVLVLVALGISRFWGVFGPVALVIPAAILLATGIALALARDPAAAVRRLPWLERRLALIAPRVPVSGFSPSLRLFALAVLAHFANTVVPFALLRSLDAPINYADAFVVGYMLTIAALVPLFFAGIGIRDVSALALLGAINIAPETTVAFSTLMLAIILLVAVAGGVIQLRAERAGDEAA